MFRKNRVITFALVLAAVAVAGTVATTSSGAGNAQRTIGLVRGTDSGFFDDVQKGAATASTALGDRLVVQATDNAQGAIDALVAQHVDAIAVDPGERGSGSTLDGSSFDQAHAAGIATLWYRNPSNGTSVWVNLSSATESAHGLADALAAQMGEKGRYVIVPCRPAYPIVQTWLRAVKAYIPARYPHMKRVAIVYGDDTGGGGETAMFARFIKKHRRVRGLIALCPTEAFVVPRAITHARKVGKVFASGNGGDYAYAPIDPELAKYVRSGAEELVSAGDPVKLGYLTVWAADYLASGHTFAPGQYTVGGPVGTVSYFSTNHELRLGQLLTITKENVDQYAAP
jgi:rhamnose transport system substrate-binding protein